MADKMPPNSDTGALRQKKTWNTARNYYLCHSKLTKRHEIAFGTLFAITLVLYIRTEKSITKQITKKL